MSYGRDKIKEGETVIQYINIESISADPLTKCLAPTLFNENVISMVVLTSFDLKSGTNVYVFAVGHFLVVINTYLFWHLSYVYSEHIMVI